VDENPYKAPQKPEIELPRQPAEETVWSMFILAIVVGAVAVVSMVWHEKRRREIYVYVAHFATIAAMVMVIRLIRRCYRRAKNRT
jgi:hypothetical protein